jgi:hypothetical protein
MKKTTIGIIKELNPLRSVLPLVLNKYDTFLHYRIKNRSLLRELNASRDPERPLVPIVSASPIYCVLRFLRCTCDSCRVFLEN